MIDITMNSDFIGTKTISCPCGKGCLSRYMYLNDWNHYYESPIDILCDNCRSKYKVESERSFCYRPGRDSEFVEYLTPINYPKYSGITEVGVYGSLTPCRDIFFSNFLIENFSKESLETALFEFENVTNSKFVQTQVSCDIRKYHKSCFDSVKVKLIINCLHDALSHYDVYFGSYDQRIVVRKQEEKTRKQYKEQKLKFQIEIRF